MARVFSAVDIEDEDLKQRLAEIRDRFDLGFNPVKEEKMHITLEFFQDISEEEIERIKQAMEEVDTEPFSSELKGVGAFPSKDYIRVIWAGANSKSFQGLYKQISKHEIASSNDHEFKPHVTFLRVEDIREEQKRKIQKMLKEFRSEKIGDLKVERVKLFQSRLKPEGSVYEKLHEVEL